MSFKKADYQTSQYQMVVHTGIILRNSNIPTNFTRFGITTGKSDSAKKNADKLTENWVRKGDSNLLGTIVTEVLDEEYYLNKFSN
jgi:hypothetical protein